MVAGENINYYLNLNRDIEDPSSSGYNWITNRGADTFTVGSQRKEMNQPNENFVAYCWHSVAGYSKVSSFQGDGSSDNFIDVGFKPSFVILKNTENTYRWYMLDSRRDPENPANKRLFANASSAEATNSDILNFESTGFRLITSDAEVNQSGKKILYMAFK